MDEWFSIINAGGQLSADADLELRDVGFVVIPGPLAPEELAQLAAAYDSVVASASSGDIKSVVRQPESMILLIGDRISMCCIFTSRYLKHAVSSSVSRLN
jgi:hypothetical protein